MHLSPEIFFLNGFCLGETAWAYGDIRLLSVHYNVRVIPISRSTHVRGFHPVRVGHPQVPFESLNESNYIDVISTQPGFRRIEAQPITIEYLCNGRRRRYTPDFLVEFDDLTPALQRLGYGLQTFVEVKPLNVALANLGKLAMQLSLVVLATGRPAILAAVRPAPTARWCHVH